MRVLVVYAHPVADSYCARLRDCAVAGLAAAGHAVDLCDLYAEGFDPVLSLAERLAHRDAPETKPQVNHYATRLKRAEALVFVYPTWWSGPPAMIKGWFDRTWVEGVAYLLPPGKRRVRGNLRNVRRIAIVATHGSSKWVNMLEGETGKRQLLRTVRVLCHPLARTRWLALYGVDGASTGQLDRFAARVERAMRRL